MLAAIGRGAWPPLLLASAAGWLALLGAGPRLSLSGLCAASSGNGGGWDWRALDLALGTDPSGLLLAAALAWLLMLAAMMPPLIAQPLAYLWTRSLARRRWRAIAGFAAAYAAVWLAAGIVLIALAAAIRTAADAAPLPPLVCGFLLALLWQMAPAKQACLNRCHRLPALSTFGLAADLDCLRYGVAAGLWCVGACWAWMLVPLLADAAQLLLMAAIAALLVAERQAPARPPRWLLVSFRTSA